MMGNIGQRLISNGSINIKTEQIMKVDFNIKLKEFDGSEAFEEKKVVKNGKTEVSYSPIIIKDLVAKALFSGGGLERTGNVETDNNNRFEAYKLSQKIIGSDKDIDLSPEEMVLVKQAASAYPSAGVYAQIVKLVDPK